MSDYCAKSGEPNGAFDETDRSVIVGRVSARSYEPRTRPHALTFWRPP